jgi:hypothetical protein
VLGAMMEKDAEEACGPHHWRGEERRGHRRGRTTGKIGFHGGKLQIERPRVCELAGKELALLSWEPAVAEGTTPIQRCQIHKARNIMQRLPKGCTPRSDARCARPGNC